MNLLTCRELQTGLPQILYWRTITGEEADFVIELGQQLRPIETRVLHTVGYSDTRSLRTFLEQYPGQATGGLILYDRTETYWAATNILVVPWRRVV